MSTLDTRGPWPCRIWPCLTLTYLASPSFPCSTLTWFTNHDSSLPPPLHDPEMPHQWPLTFDLDLVSVWPWPELDLTLTSLYDLDLNIWPWPRFYGYIWPWPSPLRVTMYSKPSRSPFMSTYGTKRCSEACPIYFCCDHFLLLKAI